LKVPCFGNIAATLQRFPEHPVDIEAQFSFHNFMASAVLRRNLFCQYALALEEATLAVYSWSSVITC